jgi:hypothetical protein
MQNDFFDSIGQTRRFDDAPITSGLPVLTDIGGTGRHVSKVPLPDSCGATIAFLLSIGFSARSLRYSGKPAMRSASAIFLCISAERIGKMSLAKGTRKAGSSCSR